MHEGDVLRYIDIFFRFSEVEISKGGLTFQQLLELFEKIDFGDDSASNLQDAVDKIYQSVQQIFKVCKITALEAVN